MRAKLGEGAKPGYDARVGSGLGRGPNLRKKAPAAPWSQTWPAPGATLDLDFANDRGYVRGVGQGRSMDAVTFTRASNGTFVKPDGTLSTHANQGALGNNLLTFPQDFQFNAWSFINASLLSAQTIAPDGTNTGSLLISNSTNGSHYFQRDQGNGPVAFISGNTYIGSIYFKKGNGATAPDIMQLSYSPAAFPSNYANFNISTGSVLTNTGGTALISDAGNGWWRASIAVTANNNSSATGVLFIGFTNNNDSLNRLPSYVDSTSSNVFIWGAQLEVMN